MGLLLSLGRRRRRELDGRWSPSALRACLDATQGCDNEHRSRADASALAYRRCMPLEPGDKAPDFTLPDQDGEVVHLRDFKGRKVLVYFYPKADTPGCTTQAQELTKVLGDIGDTAVLGISPDPARKLKRFQEKY